MKKTISDKKSTTLQEKSINEKNAVPQEQAENEILRFKHSLNFHFMSVLLILIHNCGCIYDERFRELLQALEDYVNERISVPSGLDVINEYVVSECVKFKK